METHIYEICCWIRINRKISNYRLLFYTCSKCVQDQITHRSCVGCIEILGHKQNVMIISAQKHNSWHTETAVISNLNRTTIHWSKKRKIVIYYPAGRIGTSCTVLIRKSVCLHQARVRGIDVVCPKPRNASMANEAVARLL